MALDTGIHAGMTILGHLCITTSAPAWEFSLQRSSIAGRWASTAAFPRRSMGTLHPKHRLVN
jgi:hypothetical protein